MLKDKKLIAVSGATYKRLQSYKTHTRIPFDDVVTAMLNTIESESPSN